MKFNEKEEKLITEAVSKLCIWEGHKDCLECQDCFKFVDNDCDLYDVMMDLFEKARNETATKFLFEAKRILAEYENSIYGEMFIEVFVKLLQVSKEFGVEVEE